MTLCTPCSSMLHARDYRQQGIKEEYNKEEYYIFQADHEDDSKIWHAHNTNDCNDQFRLHALQITSVLVAPKLLSAMVIKRFCFVKDSHKLTRHSFLYLNLIAAMKLLMRTNWTPVSESLATMVLPKRFVPQKTEKNGKDNLNRGFLCIFCCYHCRFTKVVPIPGVTIIILKAGERSLGRPWSNLESSRSRLRGDVSCNYNCEWNIYGETIIPAHNRRNSAMKVMPTTSKFQRQHYTRGSPTSCHLIFK